MRRHHARSPFASKVAAPLSDAATLLRTFETETNPSRPMRPSPLAASQIQDMPLDLIDRIRSFPLFQSTPESFLAEIGLHLRPHMHKPNDYILTEGEDAKAMYWLVRGAVAVCSRDGESQFAELKPGAFFGEIGILWERPRTATIIARTRCLLVSLKKEDLQKILPRYPEVEQAIREEAQERIMILERKKKERQPIVSAPTHIPFRRGSKRVRDNLSEDLGRGAIPDLGANGNKKRKSPSPGLTDISSSSALGNGLINVRMLLRELPLFANLPTEMLHFLGLNAQPRSYPPFTDIIKQDSKGREVYFLVSGEVEVLDEHSHEPPDSIPRWNQSSDRPRKVVARLKQGQYFGEVVSLSLAPRRTATVRSVTAVECLMISGEVLTEFWERCPHDVRNQVEETARKRLSSASDNDVIMQDQVETTPAIDELAIGEKRSSTLKKKATPKVTFNDYELNAPHRPARREDKSVLEPSDPDPFLSVGLDNVKSRSRRSSVATISPDEKPSESRKSASPPGSRSQTPVPGKLKRLPSTQAAIPKRSRIAPPSEAPLSKGILPDHILNSIFQYPDLHDLMRFRVVSKHWANLLSTSPHLLHYLDLTPYNRKLTDDIITRYICPFIGARPRVVDMSNCFHITDEGFSAIVSTCGPAVTTWKMKSVWDVTAPAILDMANRAKGLEDIDLSNCRKVSDTLLARIVGWVVPPVSAQAQNRPALNPRAASNQVQQQQNHVPQQPPPGTVLGCPNLKRITLSYCKHVTDRSMHHIASHAANRIEQVDLTRCTTITDTGFQYWGNTQFLRLRKLCLADCTYLTDNAIVYLANAAKGLRELDLVSTPHVQ